MTRQTIRLYDFRDELAAFYYGACGFRPVAAGSIDLLATEPDGDQRPDGSRLAAVDRRTFLRTTATAAIAAGAHPIVPAGASEHGGSTAEDPWALFDLTGREPDENGLVLPAGFRSRIVAQAMQPVADTDYVWPIFPDGGATFALDDGFVYVSNSEVPNAAGGVSAIRFDREGEITDAYSILQGTSMNCAGGATPWGTWLSCEEFDAFDDLGTTLAGQVWECRPDRPGQGTVRPAMGAFQHEAAAVDPYGERIYMTEDQPDGKLYRFTPVSYPDLGDGLLEVAFVEGEQVRWVEVPDPSARSQPIRAQLPEATSFLGGEGIVATPEAVYFTTKLDHKVWRYDLRAEAISVVYDPEVHPSPSLRGPDNITLTPEGDLLVSEDGGDMELVLVGRDGRTLPMVRVAGDEHSELAGPAFDPTGQRLFFSSQRGGPEGIGTTYEVTGPFPRPPELEAAAGAEPDGGGRDVLVPVLGGGAAAVLLGAAAVWRLRTRNPDQPEAG